jgi:hypothetical protein
MGFAVQLRPSARNSMIQDKIKIDLDAVEKTLLISFMEPGEIK